MAYHAIYRSSVIYTHIHAAPHGIYIIGLSNGFAGYTIHITTLSPQTGEQTSSQDIPSNVAPPTASTYPFILAPRGVAWLENDGGIRTVEFAPELRLGRMEGKETKWAAIRDVGVARSGWFLGFDQSGQASILEFSARGVNLVRNFDSIVRHSLLLYYAQLTRNRLQRRRKHSMPLLSMLKVNRT